jgi:hypothetical protein
MLVQKVRKQLWYWSVPGAAVVLLVGLVVTEGAALPFHQSSIRSDQLEIHRALKFDVSPPLGRLDTSLEGAEAKAHAPAEGAAKDPAATKTVAPSVSADRTVEQTAQGERPPLATVDNFDGLGQGFYGPQGGTEVRNPSDNSLAVGPNNVVQIVNAWFAVYTKTGKRLYGPVPTNEIFHGFGACGARDNGDAVVRYDQLANRWLFVMPAMRPIGARSGEEPGGQSGVQSGEPAAPGQFSVPGQAEAPRSNPPRVLSAPAGEPVEGSYGVCYAVSTGPDPLGPYYRYAFSRKNFPDYPRPAVWPDGYYVATSSGDTVIQKQICIADRAKMLKGEPATEQCIVMDGVNFLNPADIDGQQLPAAGAPEIVMADGGSQLKEMFQSDVIDYWKVHVDWDNPANTKAAGPFEIHVAPYHYLCDGQLTACVPQPGTGTRLDSQGDKLMQRLVYRRIGDQQSIVAAHSVSAQDGEGGGVRWYEFRLNQSGDPYLYQQGTYAPGPGRSYRWAPSIDMDRAGNIGVGYSFGGPNHFPGHHFAARKAGDPKGKLTFRESVVVNGEAAQTSTTRWVDFATTAMDPSDDCTFWYVGVYNKKYAAYSSTRIGSFRVPGCGAKQ